MMNENLTQNKSAKLNGADFFEGTLNEEISAVKAAVFERGPVVLQEAGAAVVSHLKRNRTTYIAVVLGAAAIGGALVFFRTWSKNQSKLSPKAPNLNLNRGRASKVAIKKQRSSTSRHV